MRHLSDRFAAAVRLCTGPAPVKERLAAAWLKHLDEIDPRELPAHLHQDFAGLREAMYLHEPQPNELAPAASIRKMSASQATRYTAMIARMLGELLRIKYSLQTEPAPRQARTMESEFEPAREAAQRLN